MTLDKMKLCNEGREYWLQYVRLNGYAFRPTLEGLAHLSRNLDITVRRLAQCITAYLEA